MRVSARSLIISLTLAIPAIAQLPVLPGVLNVQPTAGGGASVSFVQTFSGDGSASSNTITSNASGVATTTGNLLDVFWGTEDACSGISGVNQVAIHNSASDLVFTPVIPDIGGKLIGATLTSGGSGYSGSPTCTVTGGTGGPDTCFVSQAGGVLNTFSFTGNNATYTPSSPAGFTFTGGGSGATVSVVGYGIGNSSTECTGKWYAKNITGHASETVTVTAGVSPPYRAVVVTELAGANASAPLDGQGSAIGGSTSITVNTALSSSGTADAAVCGSRVEALTQTWTPGTSYTIPTNGTTPLTFTTTEYRANFAPNGTSPTISSGSSADRELICAAFKP